MKKRALIRILLVLTLFTLRALAGTTPPEQGGPSSAKPSTATRGFHPDAPYTTAQAFSKAIGKPAVMLDSPNVSLLAPKAREQAAAIVMPYLVRAYDELYKIVGVHTKYQILV